MFDWARGSVLRKMIEHDIPGAQYDTWLKGWANAWPLALFDIPKSTKVLDVGTGITMWYPQHFSKLGCTIHILDKPVKKRKNQVPFGLSKKIIRENPEITFHLGLAGEYKGPADYFNLITCISVIEHIYDHNNVLDPDNPYPHLKALHDMGRMLAPGGILVLTYDFFLNDMQHWRGWDYLADYEILSYIGLRPLKPDMQPKSRTFIYNYEDTLFMQPEGILSFSDTYIRSTSIGMIFVKAGAKTKVTLAPKPELGPLLFSNLGSTTPEPTLTQIRSHLSYKTKRLVKKYIRQFTKKKIT